MELKIIFSQSHSQGDRSHFVCSLISHKKQTLIRPSFGVSCPPPFLPPPPKPPITPSHLHKAQPIDLGETTTLPPCFLEVLHFWHPLSPMRLFEVSYFCLLPHTRHVRGLCDPLKHRSPLSLLSLSHSTLTDVPYLSHLVIFLFFIFCLTFRD